jgi:hypothetical protein
MTRMLPDSPDHSATRSEQEVFRLIKEAPNSDEFYCLHSVGLARHQRKSYGEADFIVIGPLGVFCLEVKGGEILRKSGAWQIGWPGKSYLSKEGPFKQSQGTVHPLIKELATRVSLDFKRKVLVGWGVIFPDVTFAEEDPEWDLKVVCDIRKKHDFMAFLDRLANYTRERELNAGRKYPERLTSTDCRKVVDCFRRDFDLVQRVRDLIVESRRELVELSDQQYSVMQHMLDPLNPRVMCPGAAGTGKTLIGIETARRLGRQGLSVLFLCFNRVLGEHIRGEISTNDGNVQVWSLHQFMRHIVNDSDQGDRLREAEQNTNDTGKLFRDVYPDLFETAILELTDRGEFASFDALVIDEGQDILFSPTIDAIGMALRGGLAEGRWILFYDPGLQSDLYGHMDKKVIETLVSYHPINLSVQDNFRNPEPIVDEMCKLTGTEKPVCRRRLQVRMDYRSYSTDAEQGKKLRALLVELIREGVEPPSISVLSGCRREDSCIEKFPPDVGKKIVFIEGGRSVHLDNDSITSCTVSSFKGMENEIVILTDLPVPFPEREWERSVTYVGMTRARTRVYALVNKKFLDFRFGGTKKAKGVENARTG